MGISQTFNLELYAEGWDMFTDVNEAQNNLRAIRRLDTGVQNPWQAQTGTYSNFVTSVPAPFPVMRVTATTGGIVAEGSHFTFGLEKTVVNQTVSGIVTYNNSTSNPVEGVVVTLNPGGLTATTNAAGQYAIANVPAGDYTVTASTTEAWLPADAADALLVLKSVAHNPDLTGLYLEAADVSNDNVLTSLDALRIQRRDAGLDNSFPAGDWMFSTTSVTVSNAPAVVNLKALSMGDVNGDALTGLPKQSPSVEVVKNDKINSNLGGAINVPVTVGSAMKIGAMSITMTYPVDLAKY
jgi:hypothetical protein